MTDTEYREMAAERYIRPLMEAGFTNEQANAILLTALDELNEAREWFADRSPKGYIISYYLDSECVGSETVEA